MSKKVTLGGDRLGSGKKMTVQMKNFGRSSHDQGFIFTTDQAVGALVPAFCGIGTRGDTFDFKDISSIVRTLPTNGPVFGSFKHQIDVFIAPIRLYVGALHNNATGVGLKMDKVMLPAKEHIATTYPEDMNLKAPNRASVAKTSLEAYLGLNASPLGDYKNSPNAPNAVYYKNALFELMYWDVYKNYYANKQEEEGVVVVPGSGNVRAIELVASDSNGVELANGSTGKWVLPANEVSLQSGSGIYMMFSNGLDEATVLSKVALNIKMGGKTKLWTIQEIIDFNADWDLEQDSRDGTEYTLRARADITESYEIVNQSSPAIKIPEQPSQEYRLQRFPLENIDNMRETILATSIKSRVIIQEDTQLPYSATIQQITQDTGRKRESMSKEMCGLAIKTHLSDIFNNWLQTEWLDGVDGINEITSVEIVDGKFSMNELNFKQKLFNMMNRIAIQDGSYDAWQTAVWGATGPFVSESPIYIGGYSAEIAFDEVVSTAESGEEPLGSLAGRGATQFQTKKGGRNIKIKCQEASLIMIINSFTPRVTYSQGNEWWTELRTMDDLHKPDLDGIAFQPLPSGWLAGFAESVDDLTSEVSSLAIGKQPSWIEYTTAVNKAFGSFASGGELEHMVINRTYEADQNGMITNATTYINPVEFNVLFADKELTARPFWTQIGFNLETRRVMSASQMPIM